MVAIGGGKTKKQAAATQPQYVVQKGLGVNLYMLLSTDEDNQLQIEWIGDPNAATKYASKFQAKSRTRELEDVPDGRTFLLLDPPAKNKRR